MIGETLKITNGISNQGKQFFNISPRAGNLLSIHISKIKFTNELEFFFFVNKTINFSNKSDKK